MPGADRGLPGSRIGATRGSAGSAPAPAAAAPPAAAQSPRAGDSPEGRRARAVGSPAGSWPEPTTLQASLGTAADTNPLSWVPPASAGQAPHLRSPLGRGTRATAHPWGSAALRDTGKDHPVKGRR